MIPQFGEGLQWQLEIGAFPELHGDGGQGPIGLVHRHPAVPQWVVDTDLLLQRLRFTGRLQEQLGSELFGAARRVAFDGKTIQGEGQLAVSTPIEEVDAASWCEKTLQAIARQGTPGCPHHQEHKSGVHQKRPDASHHPSACCQAACFGLHLPSLTAQASG